METWEKVGFSYDSTLVKWHIDKITWTICGSQNYFKKIYICLNMEKLIM